LDLQVWGDAVSGHSAVFLDELRASLDIDRVQMEVTLYRRRRRLEREICRPETSYAWLPLYQV
jgi:hypothetical protein